MNFSFDTDMKYHDTYVNKQNISFIQKEENVLKITFVNETGKVQNMKQAVFKFKLKYYIDLEKIEHQNCSSIYTI